MSAGETPAATLSTITDTITRVPRMHALPWHIAGFTLMRSRQLSMMVHRSAKKRRREPLLADRYQVLAKTMAKTASGGFFLRSGKALVGGSPPIHGRERGFSSLAAIERLVACALALGDSLCGLDYWRKRSQGNRVDSKMGKPRTFQVCGSVTNCKARKARFTSAKAHLVTIVASREA